RILGSNNTIEVPNQATWIALGNNVRVEGDLQRRVYPINLRPKAPNPHLRNNDQFHHPDFIGFTKENRQKILTALLTLVRAWFADGKPKPRNPVTFGSFEEFEKTIGGILDNAGIHGFLENRTSFAQESSYEAKHWEEHLHWLNEYFGTGKFTAKQVKEALLTDLKNAETPPGLEDPSIKNYSRQLGDEYGKVRERFFGGFRLVKAGEYQRAAQWRVESSDDFTPPNDGPDSGSGDGGGGSSPEEPTPTTDGGYGIPFDPSFKGVSVDDIDVFTVLSNTLPEQQHEEIETPSNDPFSTAEEEEVDREVREFNELVWDIETADGNELFRWKKGEFLTLSGYQGDEDENQITDSGEEITEAVERAERNYGWNHLAFDIPALAVHHDGVYLKMSEGAVDLMLVERQINPTDAKGVKPGYYGLDQTAKRYGHEGKTDDLRRLKAKYGGFHLIPKEELEPYLHGDLEATRFLKDKIGHHYDEDPYIQREHEVQRRVTFGPRMHGFRVDVEELNKRLEEGRERKEANLQRLHDEYGLPLGKMTEDKRKENYFQKHKNPLATIDGKKWLEEVFSSFGAPAMPRTEKSKDISTNKDDLQEVIIFYGDPQKIR